MSPASTSPKKSTRAARQKRQVREHLPPISNSLAWRSGFDIDDATLEAVSRFRNLSEIEKVREAKRIIQDAVIDSKDEPDFRFALAVNVGEDLLDGYATLDEPHRLDVQRLREQISTYLSDSTRKRPLNTLMLASPGIGKSFFINQLAASMSSQRVEPVSFNMATMQSTDDMAQPIDDLRNAKVNDKFPLLFLDEFDSDPAYYPALLPLLWDGELRIGHRNLKLGKAVVVLAGSNPDLPKIMEQAAEMSLESEIRGASNPSGKLVDLLSRINGGLISIPPLDLQTDSRDRRVDKVCMAIGLLKARFGKDLASVPRSLLRFIAHTNFRYGARSIAHLIDIIRLEAYKEKRLNADLLGLPLDSIDDLKGSSLKLHLLDQNRAFGVTNRWREFSKDSATLNLEAPLVYPSLRRLLRK